MFCSQVMKDLLDVAAKKHQGPLSPIKKDVKERDHLNNKCPRFSKCKREELKRESM